MHGDKILLMKQRRKEDNKDSYSNKTSREAQEVDRLHNDAYV